MDFNKKEMPIQGFAGFGGGATSAAFRSSGEDPVYIDDVFSTFLYEGTGANKTITNNIDLSGEGGMVWIKNREDAWGHAMFDTVRGVTKRLRVDSTADEYTTANTLTAFNSNGFTIGSDGNTNTSGESHVAYTFRKQKGFFDMKQYSGNNGTVFNLSHDLECKPCFIIIKQLNSAENWICWIKGLASEKSLRLNLTNDQSGDTDTDLGHTVTDTYIRIPAGSAVNGSGTYMCYMWGDGAESEGQIFGADADQSMVKTGTYSANGSDQSISLGWEPSWILIKKTNNTRSWFLFDNMRGVVTADNDPALYPNYDVSEGNEGTNDYIDFNPTGFEIKNNGSSNAVNDSGGTYAYVAIRRSDGYVGKPLSATDALTVVQAKSDGTIPKFVSSDLVDFAMFKNKTTTANWFASARLMQGKYFNISLNNAQTTNTHQRFEFMDGYNTGTGGSGTDTGWMWKRHQGFEVVTYKGTGSNRTVNHGMNAVPEMIWVKNRTSTGSLVSYHKGLNGGTNPQNYFINVRSNAAEEDNSVFWNDTAPTSTLFTVGSGSNVNSSGEQLIALLFASISGISKVGYYSGSNSEQTITTGFQPRFCFMKKTDSAQGWVVLDTLRGWGSGADERLEFHNDSGESDTIDFGAPISTGFTLVGNVEKSNQSGGSYIYYAHA